jgi:hypothetical protein
VIRHGISADAESDHTRRRRAIITQLDHRRKWDAGGFADLARRGHIRETSAKVISGGWEPDAADTPPPRFTLTASLHAKMLLTDYAEAYGLSKGEKWSEDDRVALQRIEERSDRVAPFRDRSAAGIRRALTDALALPEGIPLEDRERVAKDWVWASTRAQLAVPERVPTLEETRRQFDAAELRRQQEEDRIAAWTAAGWEDRRERADRHWERTRAIPADYTRAYGRWEHHRDGTSEWVPEIAPEDRSQWERRGWWEHWTGSGGTTWWGTSTGWRGESYWRQEPPLWEPRGQQ